MIQLHPIEAAWRQFRSSRNISLLHESIRSTPKVLPGLDVTKLPNEVTTAFGHTTGHMQDVGREGGQLMSPHCTINSRSIDPFG